MGEGENLILIGFAQSIIFRNNLNNIHVINLQN